MNLIFLGPQGSGKGTQAKLLAQKYKLQYFESGNVLRQKAKENTTLGREINQTINEKGKLISDQIMMQTVDTWLAKINPEIGIIFDGFPRSVAQYQILENLLAKRKVKIDRVIFLDISKEVSLKRLLARRVCPQCDYEYNLLTKPPKNDQLCDGCKIRVVQRPDDIPATIEQRLQIYYQTTQPLLDYFNKMGILEEVDGERPIEVIFQDIVRRLNL